MVLKCTHAILCKTLILARAVGVAVSLRSVSWLATMLVVTISVIIFSAIYKRLLHYCSLRGKTLIHGQKLDGFVHLGCFREILDILDFFVQKIRCLRFLNAFWIFIWISMCFRFFCNYDTLYMVLDIFGKNNFSISSAETIMGV